jgi:hypothetical protein
MQGKASNRGFHSIDINSDDAKFLVEQYKRIEELKDIAPEHALFVEFGLDPFVLYQARPFKKKQTAEFKVPKLKGGENSSFWSDFAFGTTPPEGIVLPVARSFGCSCALGLMANLSNGEKERFQFSDYEFELQNNLTNFGYLQLFKDTSDEKILKKYIPNALRGWHADIEADKEPYCLAITSAGRDTYDTDLSVPNMKALFIGQTNTFLVHNLMRLLKRAEITVGYGPSLVSSNFFKGLKSLEDKVRIISNGKEAVIMKE